MKSLLFQQIAESIRQAILYRELKPGDELPAVRALLGRLEGYHVHATGCVTWVG